MVHETSAYLSMWMRTPWRDSTPSNDDDVLRIGVVLAFTAGAMQSSKVFPEMLEDGVRVMIYAGDQDLICNWLGNRRWVDALPWGGAAEWAAAEDCDWHVGGEPAGSVRQSGPLSFVKVYDAGHMVRCQQAHSLALRARQTFL